MLEDLRESLGLSTSQEISDVFNFEVGPVYEHVLQVFMSNFDLKNIEGIYNDELRAREKLAVHWASKSDVLGSATGIEIDKDTSETVVNMYNGDQLGGLRAPVDTEDILDRVEKLRQETTDEDLAEVIELANYRNKTDELTQETVTEGAEVADFTKAQERRAREIAARNLIGKAYDKQLNDTKKIS